MSLSEADKLIDETIGGCLDQIPCTQARGSMSAQKDHLVVSMCWVSRQDRANNGSDVIVCLSVRTFNCLVLTLLYFIYFYLYILPHAATEVENVDIDIGRQTIG